MLLNLSVLHWFILLSMQVTAHNEASIPYFFDKIKNKPQTVAFSNSLPVNNEGGHLQGVQIFPYQAQDYVFLTGSSSTYAYYAAVKMDAQPRVIAINKIMDKPYKHAGGFQIFQKYMVIGVEDNEARTRSKVLIFEINDPNHPPREPMTIIERKGPFERATAGAVALTRVGMRFLLVVGDWSSRNLDFYVSNNEKAPQNFSLIDSLNIENLSKDRWNEPHWHSYQNLNIFGENLESLYLFGLGMDHRNQHVADLYQLKSKNLQTFNLDKIMSKTFTTRKGVSFQAGAGVYYKNQEMKIIACGRNIHDLSFLNVYELNKD